MLTTASTIYLGIGSNLGDRHATIEEAVRQLVSRCVLEAPLLSSVYETEAVSETPQPPYLNAVLRGATGLGAEVVLERCLAVEAACGRTRPPGLAKAPRTLDVDLLLYGDHVMRTRALEVPHPALLDRSFVLVPLAEVATAGLVHPLTGVRLDVARPSSSVRRFWR